MVLTTARDCKVLALFSYKILVQKNIKACNRSKIKNIAVILLVALSSEGSGQKNDVLIKN